MTGVPRNRDCPVSALTKLESAAIRLFASGQVEENEAVELAHRLFDALDLDRVHREKDEHE